MHAVIFDLDGVLVRTDQLHFRAWKLLADQLGMAFDQQMNHALRGVSRQESLRLLYEQNNQPLPPAELCEEQCALKNRHYISLVDQMTPRDVLPGAVELLSELQTAGVRCAIASASRNTRRVLERTALMRFADAVADGNDAPRSKPDPQVFLLAAERLDIPPSRCLAVEDAASGIEAIHRAGMVSVGIGSQTRGADLVVAGVSELTCDRLRELFNRASQR